MPKIRFFSLSLTKKSFYASILCLSVDERRIHFAATKNMLKRKSYLDIVTTNDVVSRRQHVSMSVDNQLIVK